MQMMMKGKGKGKGKGNGIKSFKGELRVWIGGVTKAGERRSEEEKAQNMRLKEHMSSTGLNCIYAEVGGNNQGGAAFKTAEEAQQAIAMLNGSVFDGVVIQVDALTKTK